MAKEFKVSLERLRSDVFTLADPELEGRKAGSFGNLQARQWLQSQFSAIGLRPLTPHYEQPIHRSVFGDVIGVNLIGILGGALGGASNPTEQSKCILIGAHYDGVGGGKNLLAADDNASGVAALLEIARTLKPLERSLQKCVIFAAWDYEEGSLKTLGGVKGSSYYVQNPLIALDRIELAIAFDLLGGAFFKGAERSLYSFGVESSKSLLQIFKRVITQDLKVRLFSTNILEPLGSLVPRSDYGPFRSEGVPHLFFTSGTPNYYHKNTDVPERLDYDNLKRITEFVLNYIWPIIGNGFSIERNGPTSDLRSEDLKEAVEVLTLLLENRSANQLSRADVQILAQDLARLRKFENRRRYDFPVCWLQVTFIDMLQALHVLGGQSLLGEIFAAKCALE